MNPSIGKIVWYRTDGRNGLAYDLPAIITCTQETHPGDYPDGRENPLSVPESATHVHLTVFTPGGFGTQVVRGEYPFRGYVVPAERVRSADFPNAMGFTPGSGTYVELNVPQFDETILSPEGDERVTARSWRWPVIR